MSNPTRWQSSHVRSLSRTLPKEIESSTDRNSGGRTLYFASSTSTTMPLVDDYVVAYTGLYKCILDEADHEKLDSTIIGDKHRQQRCREGRKVADGSDRDGDVPRIALPLHNLQFHNGNQERRKAHQESSTSYLYANTYIDHKKENPNMHTNSWEILRAELPGNTINGGLRFESVFRTLAAFDWNECGFKCCSYSPDTDDDPFQYSKEEENGSYAHSHAYVRTIPRSFSVDETTGEIYISWEGFYQNCDPASFDQDKSLEWTIGISRLRKEDPYCVTNQANIMENNFPRCTEPVSIVYQRPQGRDVVLPHGGFTVIPSQERGQGRLFLLSVLQNSSVNGKDLTSHVWAISEGGKRDQVPLSLNDSGTLVRSLFMDQGNWDGGTHRLHYNPKTGRPDHLCRSIFNKGIGCMPIDMTTTNDDYSSNAILPQGEEVIVLTEDQVTSFCELEHTDRIDRYTGLKTLVTGLEVLWDEDELNGTGSPRSVVFGCYGEEGGHGNFGIIDVSAQNDTANPVQLMNGAHVGAVLFLPQKLEQFMQSSANESIAPSSIYRRYDMTSTQSCRMGIALFLLFFLLPIFGYKRRSSIVYNLFGPQLRDGIEKKPSPESSQIHTPYMELSTIDSFPLPCNASMA